MRNGRRDIFYHKKLSDENPRKSTFIFGAFMSLRQSGLLRDIFIGAKSPSGEIACYPQDQSIYLEDPRPYIPEDMRPKEDRLPRTRLISPG
jgi:hypothetical protein